MQIPRKASIDGIDRPDSLETSPTPPAEVDRGDMMTRRNLSTGDSGGRFQLGNAFRGWLGEEEGVEILIRAGWPCVLLVSQGCRGDGSHPAATHK